MRRGPEGNSLRVSGRPIPSSWTRLPRPGYPEIVGNCVQHLSAAATANSTDRTRPRQPLALGQRPSATVLPRATDQPLVPLARRCTGVKNGGGTACDVVSFLVRLRPRISLTPGAGLPRGRSLLLRARGLDSSARPRFPGRCHLAGWQVQGKQR